MSSSCPSSPALLDIRPSGAFAASHVPRSANIPLEQLTARVHELPDRSAPLCLIDTDPLRIAEAQSALASRGYRCIDRLASADDLAESGPPRVRLWQPTPLLRQALAARPVPPAARALDLACGTGRDAVYLALHGYNVDAVDILPDALVRAASLAQNCGVDLHPLQVDLRHDWPFTDGSYDLVCMFRFLHRPILSRLPLLLRPSGLMVVETFHESSVDTVQGPRNPAHLLGRGELRAAFPGMEIVHCADAVEHGGRFFSQVIAGMPSQGSGRLAGRTQV